MAIGTGAALAAAAGIGAISGIFTSREQRRAAERNRVQPFENTTTFSPSPGSQELIDMIFNNATGAFETPVPEFPDFVGFGGFHPIDFLSFLPELTGIEETPDIPGAQAAAGALHRINALLREDPFLPTAAEGLEDVIEGPSDIFNQALGFNIGGPLFELATEDPEIGRFDDAVIGGFLDDADELLERQVGQIQGTASGLGRSTAGLERRAAADIREDLLPALANLRRDSAEAAANRQLAAGQTVAGNLGNLSAQRSAELLSAIGLAPQLESARFIGPGLAASTAGQVDALNQAADIFEANFGQNERFNSRGNLLAALGLEEGAREFGAGLRASEATALNQFNQAETAFDSLSPFLRLNQLSSLILPFASQFGTQHSEGFGTAPQPFVPGSASAGIAGGVGGIESILGLMMLYPGLFGGGAGGQV